MNKLSKLSMAFLVCFFGFFLLRGTILTYIDHGQIGIRQTKLGSLDEKDHMTGYMVDIPFVHSSWRIPADYRFKNYTYPNSFFLRTKDNNNIQLDLTVPYRIIPGHGHLLVKEGLIAPGPGGTYRFDQMAEKASDEVLRRILAKGNVEDFYNTDARMALAEESNEELNKALAEYHLETTGVLIRNVDFPKDVEDKLARIQLIEQLKLLDDAQKFVAGKQQKLDNYNKATTALLQSKTQDWKRRISNLKRAYEVGIVDTGNDNSPGSVRRVLKGLSEEEMANLRKAAAEALDMKVEDVTEAHLVGIRPIIAETHEYVARVKAEAKGTRARLEAEGDQLLAEIQADYEMKLNRILSSPGGRGYVAYQAAQNVNFGKELTYQSDDGVPYIYRLQEFARHLMGQ